MPKENENPEGENEDAEDQNDDGDEDGDGDSEEGKTGYVPPTQDEHARMVRALARRKSERDTARRELAAAKAAGVKPGKEGDTGGGDSGDATPVTAPDERVKRLAGIAALASEGMTREQARTAVRLLDLSDVEVDEDGEADGLEDAVAELKTQFPAMFTKADEEGEGGRRRPRPRTSGGRSGTGGSAKAPDDKHTDQLLRAAGYR